MRKPGRLRDGLALRRGFIPSAGLVLESLALYPLLSGAPAGDSPLIPFGTHLMATILFSLGCVQLLSTGGSPTPWYSSLPFLAAGLLLSLAGMLGSISILVLAYQSRTNTRNGLGCFARHRIPPLGQPIDPPSMAPPPLDRDSIAGILSRSSDPGARMEALLLTLKLRNKDAVSLLRIGLKDRVDDIRLLAYSLLSRKEQTLYHNIDAITERIQGADSPAETPLLYQSLVSAYWELVYCGITEGEAARLLLDKARGIAREGLRKNPGSAGLYFQLGRILLTQREFAKALSAFGQARELGIDERKLTPYFAEIAYYERRYPEVKTLLKNLAGEPSPGLSTAAGFWRGQCG